MNVALIHDWLVTYRGGEKVLGAIAEMFPEAPIYTLFYDKSAMPEWVNRRRIETLWWTNALQPLRKALLPILPTAIESLDLSAYDLVISTSSCVAKGALKRKDATHLCYLHSPMRYVWDQQEEYVKSVAKIPFAKNLINTAAPQLRSWDIKSAAVDRVNQFICNSSFVKERAEKYYGRRDSVVIHPPIELDRFSLNKVARSESSPYFLAAGALVSYKRFDLAIDACETLGKKLIVAGQGPMEKELRKRGGQHTTFVIGPDDHTFLRLLQGAEALLFPGVEDFGMIAIEAMACGTPVIAYNAGGARDFVDPGATGSFFHEATVASLCSAIRSFAAEAFDGETLNRYAQRFSRTSFQEKMRAVIANFTGKASS